MDTESLVSAGFLDEETVPGDLHGATARLRLTVSPTDEMVLPCTVIDPELARSRPRPGTRRHRVTGYLRLPGIPDEPSWLVAATLAMLETATMLSDRATATMAVISTWYSATPPRCARP